MVYSSPGNQDSPVYSPQESQDSPVYSSLVSRFGTGESFTNLREHTTIFKGSIILKSTVGYFNDLERCYLCLQKLPNLRDSN
jgi:hypothetical protein